MPKSRNSSKKSKTSVAKEVVEFYYLLVLNNMPDDCRYYLSDSKEFVLEKVDFFESNFFKDFQFDDDEKVWIGSNLYLGNSRLSDDYLADSSNLNQLVPVPKTTTLEELKKKNNKIFGKSSIPLVIIKASTVPRKLMENMKLKL